MMILDCFSNSCPHYEVYRQCLLCRKYEAPDSVYCCLSCGSLAKLPTVSVISIAELMNISITHLTDIRVHNNPIRVIIILCFMLPIRLCMCINTIDLLFLRTHKPFKYIMHSVSMTYLQTFLTFSTT